MRWTWSAHASRAHRIGSKCCGSLETARIARLFIEPPIEVFHELADPIFARLRLVNRSGDVGAEYLKLTSGSSGSVHHRVRPRRSIPPHAIAADRRASGAHRRDLHSSPPHSYRRHDEGIRRRLPETRPLSWHLVGVRLDRYERPQVLACLPQDHSPLLLCSAGTAAQVRFRPAFSPSRIAGKVGRA